MKDPKYLFLASFAAIVLWGCSKGPQEYIDELQDLHKQYEQLVDEGKTEEARQINEQESALIQEMNDRCLESESFRNEIEKINGQTLETVDEANDDK